MRYQSTQVHFLPGNSALLLAVRDKLPEYVEALLLEGMVHLNDIFNLEKSYIIAVNLSN